MCGVGGEVGFERFRDGVKAVPPQEQGVVVQRHAVLLWPRGGAEGAGPVDEDYALLEHCLTLWHAQC